MKRLFDLVVSLLALIGLSPLFLIAAIAVRVDSPGPILFRQERVGKDAKLFRILKFRSMVTQPSTAGGADVTVAGDPRVTRTGRVLRTTKIDELPQLINVFRGEMSIVGPRPEVPRYVDFWDSDLRASILSVRPGITDPATLELRRESEILATQSDPEMFYVEHLLPKKTALYDTYVRSRSFRGDLKIIAQTIERIVRG
jgi:lipopolysaccharide/colanic/teichoic acid biosynthesis glycosyltransferase